MSVGKYLKKYKNFKKSIARLVSQDNPIKNPYMADNWQYQVNEKSKTWNENKRERKETVG